MSDTKVKSAPGAALTVADIIDISMGLMESMPAPDEDGVFDDEALDEWEDELKFTCSSISDKAHVLRMVADRIASEAAFVSSQEDLLAWRRRILNTKRERVVGRIKTLLTLAESLTGKPKVETSDSSWVGIRRTVKKVVRVSDNAELPDSFVRIKREPNKTALMECYKDTPDLLPDGVTVEDSHSEAVMWPGRVK